MLKRMGIWFTLCLLFGAAVTAAHAQSVTDVVRKVKPAVVSIYVKDSGDYELNGSGFFVDPSHVVTSWHVVRKVCNVRVKGADGKFYEVKGITAKNEKADLVSLALTSSNSSMKPLKIASVPPQEGDSVVVIGSPAGLELTVSNGIVSAIRMMPTIGRVIQLTAPVSPGSSGSPVVNMSGEVIGVVAETLQGAQNVNLAVSAEQLRGMRPYASVAALCPAVAAGAGAGPSGGKEELTAVVSAVNSKDYNRALSLVTEVLRSNPNNADAWYLAGHSYLMTDQDQSAATAFKKVIAIDPSYQAAYRGLGLAFGAQGKFTDAITVLKAAIYLKPDDPISHFALGTAYAASGDKAGALSEYNVLKGLSKGLADKLFEVIYSQGG